MSPKTWRKLFWISVSTTIFLTFKPKNVEGQVEITQAEANAIAQTLEPPQPPTVKIVVGQSEEEKRIANLPPPPPPTPPRVVVARSTPTRVEGNQCNCFAYVVAKTGINPHVGLARYWPVNSHQPKVGGIVVTAESSMGHVAIIEAIQDNQLILDESNYVSCQATSGRTLPIDSPKIIGYYI